MAKRWSRLLPAGCSGLGKLEPTTEAWRWREAIVFVHGGCARLAGWLLLVAVLAYSRPMTNAETAQALLLSAVGFFGYNLLSLFVLLLLNAVAHSVANTCRRYVARGT